MKLGALCFFTDRSIAPAELAQALEASGFESLWVGDHSHVPFDAEAGAAAVDSRTGKPVPVDYARLLDPFLALMHAAAVTTTLRLGTSVCLLNERDILNTAKAVTTLDHLSGGRFEFGIGAGWSEQEMRNHGADPGTRYPAMRERVEALRAIWTSEIAEYQGEHVRFGPLYCWPKPVQRPHPPILIGGHHHNIPRVVAYGDGWIPSTTVRPDSAFLERIPELRRRAGEAGRPRPQVTAVHVTDVDALASGSGAFTDAEWDTWARAGVDRTVLILPPTRDGSLRFVERYARFAFSG